MVTESLVTSATSAADDTDPQSKLPVVALFFTSTQLLEILS